MAPNMPENRVPVALIDPKEAQQLRWLNTYDQRFTHPFFDDTIRSLCLADAVNRDKSYTGSLAEMQQEAQNVDALSPSVIIFHLSRCGSTLTSQLFATSGRFTVLSEVPFFDDLLSLPYSAADIDKTRIPGLLSSALQFYGRKRNTAEEHLVIKTDCWHILFYDTLRTLFPATPFVLMYRSPDEVFRSLNKIPGRQIIPELVDPRIFGLPGMPDPYSRDIYTATILEKMLRKFLEVSDTDDSSLLVNYNEGAMAIVQKITAFANIVLDETELSIMKDRSCYHSKKPGDLFDREPAAETPPCLGEAMRLYQMLETKRLTEG